MTVEVSLKSNHQIGDTVVYFYAGMVQTGTVWHIEFIMMDDGSTMEETSINVKMFGSSGAVTHFVPVEDIIVDTYFRNISELFDL